MHINADQMSNTINVIDMYSMADLQFPSIISQIIQNNNIEKIINNYYEEKKSSFSEKPLESIILNYHSDKSKYEELIRNEIDNLKLYYVLGGKISTSENSTDAISFTFDVHCKKLQPAQFDLNTIKTFFSLDFSNFLLLSHTEQEKHFLKIKEEQNLKILKIIIPIQFALRDIKDIETHIISSNQIAIRKNNGIYFSIEFYKADIDIKENMIVIEKNSSDRFQYQSPSGYSFNNDRTAILPNRLILRFKQHYCKIDIWGSHI